MSVTESTIQRYTLADPDVRMMLEVRDGSAAAFEELMLRYQDRVVNLLSHLIGDRDHAEDLAQDVFLRVYRARERYVPGAKFSTWLFTIANNVASNARRTLARRREINLVPQSNDSTAMNTLDELAKEASGLMPARQLDRTEMREVVKAAIGQLNERQRMAVLLSKFEDMSYTDIAEVMDLTPQAIKSLLSRARGNLKEILEPYLARGERPHYKNGGAQDHDE